MALGLTYAVPKDKVQRRRLPAVKNKREFPGQILGAIHGCVQAKPCQQRTWVGSISGDKQTAFPVFRDQPSLQSPVGHYQLLRKL
ncbi:uncharacterized protein N7473_011011 [Penicillium subrubescens]|uniref:uncharacterized protein n=1 Tax=Penicillium subrubescens TaxID=1316194 RepID=UPI00254582B1|nr:uncharacterized protein N7473_011011 [Penicillium subrubescens]KAJ5884125.1 hypothetical protein N7473_011011 [Penicillium subrubescens]